MFISSASVSSSDQSSIPSRLPVDASEFGNAAQVLSSGLFRQPDTSGSFVLIPSFVRLGNPALPPIPSVIEIVRYSRPSQLSENIPVLADKSDPDVVDQLRADLNAWVDGAADLLEKNERGNIMIRVVRCFSDQKPELTISSENITDLPNCIGLLSHLTTLDLSNCRSLRSLPNVLHYFENLRYLILENCSNLTALPPTVMGLHCSASVYLQGSGIDLSNPLGGMLSTYLPPPPPAQR